jgi:hypothetical protein
VLHTRARYAIFVPGCSRIWQAWQGQPPCVRSPNAKESSLAGSRMWANLK